MESKHTPTPWKLGAVDESIFDFPTQDIVADNCGHWIALVNEAPEEGKANAELIVHRVNTYEELRDALQMIASREPIESYPDEDGATEMCLCCKYKWNIDQPESHDANCAYVIATAALSRSLGQGESK